MYRWGRGQTTTTKQTVKWHEYWPQRNAYKSARKKPTTIIKSKTKNKIDSNQRLIGFFANLFCFGLFWVSADGWLWFVLFVVAFFLDVFFVHVCVCIYVICCLFNLVKVFEFCWLDWLWWWLVQWPTEANHHIHC